MSGGAAAADDAWLRLPGFMPDAFGFAVRTTLSLLLAYGVAFAIQLDTASSAGLCVAIVAQPTPGMAMVKAVYRTLGTVVGGVAALVLVAAFPQDRTMLLTGFTLWLGACTFVAALLRDFRSYGAVLCGYTVGVIAVAGIDAPDGVLLSTLNRVAAILLGIASVAAVNLVFSGATAFGELTAALQRRLADAEGLARSALAGQPMAAEPLPAQVGAAILALRSQALYSAAEVPDGARRQAGATAAVAGLLGMLAATRALATGLQLPIDEATRRAMADALGQLGDDAPHAPVRGTPATPLAAALLDRANELLAQHDIVRTGMRALAGERTATVRMALPVHLDWIGAALSAARTIIAVAAGSVFCIYAGWPGATLLLVQQAAFTALLGMTPNPSAGAVSFGIGLPPMALAAGYIGFVLLPQASGFVPFALAVAPFAFAAALATRQPALAPYSGGLLLYLTLLLSPANTESFDLAAYLNTLLVQAMAVLFMLLAFRFVLPVSRRRRLFRVADAVGRQLRRSLDGHLPRHGSIAARCLRFDRLAQAQVWLGRPTPARLAVLERLSAFSEMDSALRRAWAGTEALGVAMPPREADAMEGAAQTILRDDGHDTRLAVQAAAGLYGSAVLLRQHGRAMRRYGVLEG